MHFSFIIVDNITQTIHYLNIQSFGELVHRPLLVDLTIEDQSRLKVIYGSAEGFHAVDLDSATVYDIYLPKHVSIQTSAHCTLISYDRFFSKYSFTFPFRSTDSGSNNTTLYRGTAKFKRYTIAFML